MSCNKCEKKPSRIDDVRAIGNSKCGAVCGMPFKKVVIPAVLGGDDEDYAPENGAYKNALVEYEANGALYIYSSDGIFTKLTGKMGDQVLYNSKGNNTDGAMTQRATTFEIDALESSLSIQHNELTALYAKQSADVTALNKRIDDAEIGGSVDPTVITRLEDEIATKASADDLTNYINSNNTAINDLNNCIAAKADTATVTANKSDTDAKIAALETRINQLEALIPNFTITNANPGEGATLADNHFIGVYQ